MIKYFSNLRNEKQFSSVYKKIAEMKEKKTRKLWRVLNVKAFLQFRAPLRQKSSFHFGSHRLKTQDDKILSPSFDIKYFYISFTGEIFPAHLNLTREKGNFQTKVRQSSAYHGRFFFLALEFSVRDAI